MKRGSLKDEGKCSLGRKNCMCRGLQVYDVVGPICESSDTFGTDEILPTTERGDFIALRSAGAYGETMSSTYNRRSLPKAVFSL